MARVAFYSHDTFGLGHIRRCLKLAAALSERLAGVEGLLITGSPWARLFPAPDGFSFLQLPPVVKEGDGLYRPRFPGASLDGLLVDRSRKILEAAQGLDPELMIVDNVPCGLAGEVLPALHSLKARGRARLVLSLREILDRPQAIRSQWATSGAQEPLSSLYDEIWVFGPSTSEIDPRIEYELSPEVAAKVVFCGYLRSHSAFGRGVPANGNGNGNGHARPFVVVTGGGGGDADLLITTYLRMIKETRPPVRSLIVLGPDFPSLDPARFEGLSGLDVEIVPFVDDMPSIISRADAVISMAGYNTICEILEAGRRAVLVPRVWPREEQRLRALSLAGRSVVVREPSDLSPRTLRSALDEVLAAPEPEPVSMTGGTIAADRAADLLRPPDA